MSEVVLANVFNYDQKFRVVKLNENTVRVYKYVDLPAEHIEVFPLDKPGQQPVTGKVELHIPLWLFMDYKEFFEK